MKNVNVANFARAESDVAIKKMYDIVGLGTWFHLRAPTPLDRQEVIRMNRDTLYSSAVLDLSEPAIVIMPETGGRYQSLQVISQDHHSFAKTKPGRYEATLPVTEAGLYKVSDGINIAMAAVGALNSLEWADVRASETIAMPVAAATQGSVNWLGDGLPSIRRVKPDRSRAGRGWIGLVANGDYLVTGVRQVPAYPALIALLLALGAAVLAWRREGR